MPNKGGKDMLKKVCVVGIIFLFITGGFVPSTISDVSSGDLENNGSLSGYITDNETNSIESAKVTIRCGEITFECYSNDTGYYYKGDIPIVDCYWNISAYRFGYHISYDEIPIDENTTQNFTLTPRIGIFVGIDFPYPGNGTIGNPYHYIWQGVENASACDVIYVYNGTYYENLVIRKPIELIGENKNTTIIDGGQKFDIIVIYADNVTISGFTLQNAKKYNGIFVDESNNTMISNNTINNTSIGINLYLTCRNTLISDNCVTYSENNGIVIQDSSDYNIICRNKINHNKNNSIYIFLSNGNSIFSNLIEFNYNGILIDTSYGNQIYNNYIQNNYNGINIFDVSLYTENMGSNCIYLNHITNNSNIGIYSSIMCMMPFSSILSLYNLTTIPPCLISKNNFIGNEINAYSSEYYNNIFSYVLYTMEWNNNYWDDWDFIGNYGIVGDSTVIGFIGLILKFFDLLDILMGFETFTDCDSHPSRVPYDIPSPF